MPTPKPCKWCGSIWHSKNKCDKREIKPFQETYNQKRPITQLSPKSPSDRLRMAYKGKSDRSQLIGYADKYFSLYIRQRGSDMGYNHCYTCGVRLLIEELQCGHFIPRRYLQTRWNKLNCWPQCNTCNVEKHGNLVVYEQLLRKEFGDLAVDTLFEMSRNGQKFTTMQIEDIVNEHKGVVL